jgi:hypothetical protein
MADSVADQLSKYRAALYSEIDRLPRPSGEFLFSPAKPGCHDPATIDRLFAGEWAVIERDRDPAVLQSLQALLTPGAIHDLTVIDRLHGLQSPSSGMVFPTIQDICLARVLKDISSLQDHRSSPHLYAELLNFYNQRPPEFLLLAEPLLTLTSGRDFPLGQEIKTQACAVLINHVEIETLIIYVSCNQGLLEEEKQTLFQGLTAFQKIYRKMLELQAEIGNKDLISLKWFGEDFDHLKKRGRFRVGFSSLVGEFLELFRQRNKREALRVGRFLVLRHNNEDILRILHSRMEGGDLKNNFLLKHFIFRQIYMIMQEFRREYISQKVDSELTRFISEMETQNSESLRLIIAGEIPAPSAGQAPARLNHWSKRYFLNPRFTEILKQYHLSALFDLYPVSPRAQEVLLRVSRIADNLELQKEELVKFISYLERLLIFLQQLTEMKIQVLKSPRYGLILNPFQMNSLSLINEGAYFGSTGYWMRSTVPPGLIRCINPRSIPNCLGLLDRHVFSRVSLLTGAFRGAPFDLDSTNRYDWDEEPETCQIRPGYFLLKIPARLTEFWEKTQNLQQAALQEKIKKKEWG